MTLVRRRTRAAQSGPVFINPWKRWKGSFIPEWLERRSELSPGVKMTYGRLMRYAGKAAYCYPKVETLAGALGVSDRQAKRYLKELRDAGLVSVKRRGHGQPNEYRFLEHRWMRDVHRDGEGPAAERGDANVPTPAGSWTGRQDTTVPREVPHPSPKTGHRRPSQGRESRKRVREESEMCTVAAATAQASDTDSPSPAGAHRRKSSTEADDVALQRLSSGRGIALLLQKKLAENAEVAGTEAAFVNVQALTRQLNERHRKGQSRELQAMMADVYAKRPRRYFRGDAAGWQGFLWSAAKLEPDANNMLRAGFAVESNGSVHEDGDRESKWGTGMRSLARAATDSTPPTSEHEAERRARERQEERKRRLQRDSLLHQSCAASSIAQRLALKQVKQEGLLPDGFFDDGELWEDDHFQFNAYRRKVWALLRQEQQPSP